jgi:hypothetical protein
LALSNIDFPILQAVDTIDVSRNGPTASPGASLNLPDMITCGSLSVSDVGYINLSSFSNAGGDLTFSFNSFETLSMPDLLTVDGSLSITNNSKLSEVDSDVISIGYGGLVVTNNPSLNSINMSRLDVVYGNATLTGPLIKSVTT